MILLVDAGNSRIKWQIRAERQVLEGGSVATGDMTEPAAELSRSWSRYKVACAVLSCVAGELTQDMLTRLLADQGGAVHWLLAARAAHGLVNHYQPPERLGSDRYAALIAASRLDLGDCLVVCVGTALTADMLTRDGEFLGGAIVPGPNLMRAALARGTAQVAPDPAASERLPRTTDSAVATGIGLALAGVVRGMRERLALSAGAMPKIVLTGGARAELRPFLGVEAVEVEDLVLEGLAWIARDLGCDG